MQQWYRAALVWSTLVLLASGCQSVDRILWQPSRLSLNNRLPSLEIRVDNGALAQTDVSLPDDAEKLFEREVRMNLSDPEDTLRYGYALLQVTHAAIERSSKGLQVLQLVTFMLPSLVGVPLEHYQSQLTAQVQIANARGQVLATYTATGASRVKVAMYHGYSQSEAPRLAEVAALRGALAQIKPQLEQDASRLRLALLGAGPVAAKRTPPTPAAAAGQ
ncbi:hypothetical protein D3Y59_08290 [Hymenobacter oligotrophus]|uniref:Lipoprotein n=1 Tax=Hymenobacter oligotrophus TaxID=2319843 RepID=A0A3B7R012_9BACT|nr:hypothetical protein [Hymenobacter oligotrophus]AYA37052.1 hypothetical protein D3Y59_08290 [Hymenobacter oligotrophus]